MKQAEIEQMLIKVVCDIQEQSGREVVDVCGETCPILDLEDFDSLNGVEATVDVFDQLELELDFNNVFVEGNQALTITQAAKRIYESAPKKIAK